MTRYSIGVTLDLVNNFSDTLERITGSAKGSMAGLRNALGGAAIACENQFDAVAGKVQSALPNLGKIAAGAAVAGVGALTAGVASAQRQFIDFDQALYKAGAIFSDMDPLAEDFKERLDGVGQAARDVAAVTEFNATQTADALGTMAMAGFQTEQALAMLPKVADLATAAGLDLNTAVGMAADTMGTLGMMSEDPVQLAENFTKAGNMMSRAANLANQDISMVYEAINAGGAVFANSKNQSMEDLGALIDALASRGTKGAEAGTAIRNMMNSLMVEKSSGMQPAALKALGIQRFDAEGNITNVLDMIEQIERASKDMTEVELNTHLLNLFGEANVNNVEKLLGVGSKQLRKYKADLQKASDMGGGLGSMGIAAQTMRESTANKIAVLQSGLTELGFKIVKPFQKRGLGLLDRITEFVNTFDPSWLISQVDKLANAVEGVFRGIYERRDEIMDFLGQVKNMAQWIIDKAIAIGGALWKFRDPLLAALKVFLAIKTGMVIVGGIMKVIKGIEAAKNLFAGIKTGIAIAQIVALKVATIAYSVAQGVANAAAGVFNALFVASPIGLIVLGIAALIAVIILCVKYWDQISAAIQRAWQWLKDTAAMIWDNVVGAFTAVSGWVSENTEKVLALISVFTGPFGIIISMIHELVSGWDSVTAAFQSGGIIGAIKQIGLLMLSGLLAPVQGLLEMISKIPGIGSITGGWAEKIASLRAGLTAVPETSAAAPGGNGAEVSRVTSASLVTPGERTAYSRSESFNNTTVEVRPAPGAQARPLGPVSPNVVVARSGAY